MGLVASAEIVLDGTSLQTGKYRERQEQMAHPINVNEADFQAEVLKSKTPVLVDFWAEWCGPCKMVAPVVEKIANDYDGRVKVAKVDVESNPQLSGEYGVRSIPTFLIFKNGEPVEQVVGALPETAFVDKLESVLAAA